MKLPSRIHKVLCQVLKISNTEALDLLMQKKVKMNGHTAIPNQTVSKYDSVYVDEKCILSPEPFHYILFNKPRGIECTLNTDIAGNLLTVLDFPLAVFPVGRLDKDSEGLLLLTNDGSIFDKILRKEADKEKEYEVQVDKELTADFLVKMRDGVEIMKKMTHPAKVKATGMYTFDIILTEGLNRQIRRMCHKSDYKVVKLYRKRIMHLEIGELESGKWRNINSSELLQLKIACGLLENDRLK